MWMKRAGRELLSRPDSFDFSPKRSTPGLLTTTVSAPDSFATSCTISAGWRAATSCASRKSGMTLWCGTRVKPSHASEGALAPARRSSTSMVRASRTSRSRELSLAK
jgi:hypothetical protein